MARALFPEEESAIDYKVVELDARQRWRLNRNFFAAVIVFLLLVAFGVSFIFSLNTGSPDVNPQQNDSVSPEVATIQVEDTTARRDVADDHSIQKWKSYIRFEEPAPLEPMMPVKNAFLVRQDLSSHGNASLYVEVHPEYCLLVLSRRTLTEDELTDAPKFRSCYGQLERNLRTTHELVNIDLWFLHKWCDDVPVIPVVQKKQCEQKS